MASKSPLSQYTLYHLMKTSASDFSSYTMQKYKGNDKKYRDITYKEAYENIRHIGAGLLSLGVKHQENIGFIADVGHNWLQISMGITGIGAVDVPRGTDATRDDLVYILNHAESRILIVENESVMQKISGDLEKFQKLEIVIFYQAPQKWKDESGRFRLLTLDELKKAGGVFLAENPRCLEDAGAGISENDLATIVYTSGTTGNPKGVMLTHRNLTWEAETITNVLSLQPGNSIMGFLPPWHIAERLCETSMLRIGGIVAFTSIPSLADDLKAVNPVMLLSVPRVWESFYAKMQDRLSNAPGWQRELFKFFSQVSESYSEALDSLMGRKFRLQEEETLDALIQTIYALVSVVILFLPNLVGQQLLARVKEALGKDIRFAFSGAGALPIHIDRFFNSIGLPIIEAYGMTETTGVSVAREIDHIVVGTVGKPLEGIKMKLLDEQGREIREPGKKGVAWHKGPHIMKGYYKEEKKTGEILVDGWLNSGDIMMWTTTGELKFAGRAKDTIVLLGGENVEPEPIEKQLVQSELIDQAVVVGQDQKTLGALLVANPDNLARRLNRSISSGADLNGDKEVMHLIRQEIKDKVSAQTGFKAFERVTTFRLVPQPFTVGEELTQTLKVRRNVVFDKYTKQIEEMFHSS